MGQTWPATASYCSAQELRTVSTFLNGWGKKYFVMCESDVKFKLQGPQIKFYWKAATLAQLNVVCGRFCTEVSGLRTGTETKWPAEA